MEPTKRRAGTLPCKWGMPLGSAKGLPYKWVQLPYTWVQKGYHIYRKGRFKDLVKLTNGLVSLKKKVKELKLFVMN